jgi:hypothetical protein
MKAFFGGQTDSSFTAEMANQFEVDYKKVKKLIKNPAAIIFSNAVVTPSKAEDEIFSKIGKGYNAVVFITSEGKKYKLTLTEIVDYKDNFYGFNLKKVEAISTPITTKKPAPQKIKKKG